MSGILINHQAGKAGIWILLAAMFFSSTFALGTKPAFASNTSEISQEKNALLDPIQINFNTYTPTPFGSQDVKPTMTIEDGGNTLHLKGNSWKKIDFPYTVTAYTVLEFDFKSPVKGEVHGIGFENDQSMSAGLTFQLYGSQPWGRWWSFFTNSDLGPEWKHYKVPVGEKYTGNMLYIVFVNDHDVSNPTGESYFRNVKVSEDPIAITQPPVDVDFSSYTISPYSGDTNMTTTLEDGGTTLHMIGNGWLKMSLPYMVTSSTVIEFDFKSTAQGEVHGLGFDDDNSFQGNRTFQLYGSQGGWGLDGFHYSLYAPEWKHFRIPVGKYYTGEMRYVFFANDHDISNPTGEGYFRNLNIYEGNISLPVSINFNQYVLSDYYNTGGNSLLNVSVEDNGNTLHLSGNGWMQISMPIEVIPDTVIEFDFKSTAQGEVHGIGLDPDLASESGRTFKVYGIQGDYGLADFNDYAPSAPNWKHYIIPIGQYFYGEQLYLFFANDHDVPSPTAESYFSNVQIHGDAPTTPTPTSTPTPTFTSTPTPTLTFTSTPTPTNTPPPNSGGNGTCWGSKNSWSGYTVFYTIDRNTIPVSYEWDTSIFLAAQTWNDVTPSHFMFTYDPTGSSNNIVSYGLTQNQYAIADTTKSPPFVWMEITEKDTQLNSALNWDTNNTPIPDNPDSNGSTDTFNLQNAVTHEFGHWLDLWDVVDVRCERVTMWHKGDPGEIKKITLENADEFAINWQYP